MIISAAIWAVDRGVRRSCAIAATNCSRRAACTTVKAFALSRQACDGGDGQVAGLGRLQMRSHGNTQNRGGKLLGNGKRAWLATQIRVRAG